MKQILLFCFFVLGCFNLIGQQSLKYTVSKPFRVIDGAEKYYFSSWDEDKKEKTLSVKRDGKDIYMQSFNATSMTEIKRNKISDMPEDFVIEDMTWVGTKAYCFFSVWDKKNTTEQLFAREIDFEGCAFKGVGKRIIATEGKIDGAAALTYGFFSFGVTDKFAFISSRDNSKILIQYRKVAKDKRDAVNHDLIGLYVFDEDMNPISKGGEIEMPYTERVMDNEDYQVDSDGKPYVLAKVREKDTDKDTKGAGKNKEIIYHYELLNINMDNKNIKISRINLDEFFMKDVLLYEGVNKNIVCAGFYKHKNDTRNLANNNTVNIGRVNNSAITGTSFYSDGNADGLFLFDMDEDGNLSNKKFYEIPVEVINQYQREAAQKKNEKKDEKGKADLAYLELREIHTLDDGGLIIIGEQYYKIEHRSSRGNVYYTYHYEDILVTKIDANGKLVWMKKLPKKQQGGRGQGGLGFKYMEFNNNHYFAFIDNVKNMSLSLDKRPAMHMDGAGGFLTCYKIDNESGNVAKYSVFDLTKVDGGYKVEQFSVHRVLEVSDDEFIMELYKNQKEDVMIKVKVQ